MSYPSRGGDRIATLGVAVLFSITGISTVGAQSRIPAAEREVVAAAIERLNAGDAAGGLAYRARVSDPVARKVIHWWAFARPNASGPFPEAVTFIRENHDWPWQRNLAEAAERSITPGDDPALIMEWFALQPPQTADGLVNSVAALRRARRESDAQALIRRAWTEVHHEAAAEKDLLARFEKDLRPQDHGGRLDFLLSGGHEKDARRFMQLPQVEARYRSAAEVRLLMRDNATRQNVARIQPMIDRLPAEVRAEEGFLFDHMRWHRRGGRNDDALRLLDQAPATLKYADDWWRERNLQIRQAIARKEPALAYRLARSHRQGTTRNFVEAEFLAGYVAFRLTREPETALRHFATGQTAAMYVADRTRLGYWRAQAARATGDEATAKALLEETARYGTTFYGQLAAGRLGRKEITLLHEAPRKPENAAFYTGDELLRATYLMGELGHGQIARSFAIRTMLHRATAAEHHHHMMGMIDRMTSEQHRLQTSVRLVKFAQREGHPLVHAGYPTIALPEQNLVEPALVYALIRQESEFSVTARSWVGARGLMQLMHFTARAEARDLKLPYSLQRLTSDPAYNLRLGTHHMDRLLGTYDGSYPLALAAYNAGPHRADRWLQLHGDPRKDKDISWEDWIELIPFEETRGYVKRVLEALPVYRLQLKDDFDARNAVAYWTAPEYTLLTSCRLIAAGQGKPFAPEKFERKVAGAGERVVPLGSAPVAPPATAPEAAETKPPEPPQANIRLLSRPHDNVPGTADCG